MAVDQGTRCSSMERGPTGLALALEERETGPSEVCPLSFSLEYTTVRTLAAKQILNL